MYFDVNGDQVFAATGDKPFDSDKPTVVFLHGSGLDHTFWELHARFFAFHHYSVLVPDLPGHTHSAGPPLTSIELMADWLRDALCAVDAGNVSVVAHSQGCLVALEYASRTDEDLKSVSLLASGLATPVNKALIDAAENDPDAAIAMMLDWGFSHSGKSHVGPVPGNPVIDRSRKVMRRNTPEPLATDLKACDAYENGKNATGEIQCPVQVILAGKDRMTPRKTGLELIEHLTTPQVHTLEECGHMIPQEKPNESRALLKEFIFNTNPIGSGKVPAH